jgi:hypothetical protein
MMKMHAPSSLGTTLTAAERPWKASSGCLSHDFCIISVEHDNPKLRGIAHHHKAESAALAQIYDDAQTNSTMRYTTLGDKNQKELLLSRAMQRDSKVNGALQDCTFI